MAATHSPIAIAVAVGPDPREVDRLIDLADSVAAYEMGPAHFVMIDDSPMPRGLAERLRLPASITPISLHHPRHHAPMVQFRIGKGICSAVLLAMGWIQANTTATFALKLDTDSLVIGPFRERLARLFESAPEIGIIGAYRQTPNNTARDWTNHGETVQSLFERPIFDWRHPISSTRRRRAWTPPPMASIYHAALANGYEIGEHCMGGGYAVCRSLLDAMRAAGHFEDVSRWTSVDLPEDVMMGMHALATDHALHGDVQRGGVFGVRYKGLPFAPEDLVEYGYSVIHAVKNDDRLDEASIRAFFANRRNLR